MNAETLHTQGLQGTQNTNVSAQRTLEPIELEAISGPSRGAHARLEVGSLWVGSSDECDLVLSDPSVSRRHLLVERETNGVRVRDLSSRNGTRYLGARISEARIPVGGMVQIGRTQLRFVPANSGAAQVSERTELCGLIGRSVAMRRLFSVLERLGPTDAGVLIRGETGVGKDAVARALHALSPRSAKPFVVFDCASVNPNLIESELFGHARGAFTGADRARMGAIESAEGGTLFLDEIGELPLDLQPKLLRILEGGDFQRVGDTQRRGANVRVIAATHRDLEGESQAGRFRSDLYFRLAVTVLQVPALRERPEDIPVLAAHFARELLGEGKGLLPSTLAAFQCSQWPGNVRELRNAVERVVAIGEQRPPLGEGGEEENTSPSFKKARETMLEGFEKDYVVALLARHQGNLSAAARSAGLSRTHLYRLMERYGITP